MSTTIATVKQVFNATSIIGDGLTVDKLTEGQIGIFGKDGLSVTPAPEDFSIASNWNGKIYKSIAPISGLTVAKQTGKSHQVEEVNVWEGLITNCSCITSLKLSVGVYNQELVMRDGLSWTHRDIHFVEAPAELSCFDGCTGHAAFDNNVFTAGLIGKVNMQDSSYYRAEGVLVEDVTLSGAVVPAGTVLDASQISELIALNKAAADAGAGTPDESMIKLRLVGKEDVDRHGNPRVYKDLEANYVFPRGTTIDPSIIVNGAVPIFMTEIEQHQFEVGAGYDLRAEEFDCMNYYTNLNNDPQLSDGLASYDLMYQFENNTNYDTLSFEYNIKKTSGVSDGDRTVLGITIGSSIPKVITDLATSLGDIPIN